MLAAWYSASPGFVKRALCVYMQKVACMDNKKVCNCERSVDLAAEL